MLNGKCGKHFAVEFHVALLQGCDEGAVAFHTVFAKCSVQADNPEGTIIVLLITAVSEGVLSGVNEGLVCATLLGGTLMAIALSALQDIPAAL